MTYLSYTILNASRPGSIPHVTQLWETVNVRTCRMFDESNSSDDEWDYFYGFSDWLTRHDILHHFEVMTRLEPEANFPRYGMLAVIHLYDPNDALFVRLHLGRKPLGDGWRNLWLTTGRASHDG